MIALLSKGPQDSFITGNPEISYFRSVYKKHTNFSQAISEQVIEGEPRPNNISTICFERKGDLLSYCYLKCLDNNNTVSLTSAEWSNCISQVELLIGGSVIDKQTSEFSETIAIDTFATSLSKSPIGSHHSGYDTDSYFFPFRFHFFEHWNSGIPLVALKYQNVEIRITWKDPPPNFRFVCMAMFTYLDNTEIDYFMSYELQMLIKQTQINIPSNTHIQELNFNHPISFLSIPNKNDSDLFSNETMLKLQINGQDYFDYLHVIPDLTQVSCYYHCPYSIGNFGQFILIPFCLNTSSYEPCGSINFSRISNCKLSTTKGVFLNNIYAVNYNIFTIKNGIGAVMYAN